MKREKLSTSWFCQRENTEFRRCAVVFLFFYEENNKCFCFTKSSEACKMQEMCYPQFQ